MELWVRWPILYVVSRIGASLYDDCKSCSLDCDIAARDGERSTNDSIRKLAR